MRSAPMFAQFWKSEEGNYAAIFAIAILPVMAGVAGVVDYSGTSNDVSKLQNTLDATALEIATKHHAGMTKAEAQQIGTVFFAANIYDASAASDFAADVATVGGVTQVSATAKIHHAGMIGGPTIWQGTRTSV